MIKIEYDKNINEHNILHMSQVFNSLKVLEDWMFELLDCPATNDSAMFFPLKENIKSICIHPENKPSYFIHNIYYNGDYVFTDGKNKTGQKFMATAIDKWLRHCHERRFAEIEFTDIEDIE